MMTKHDMPPLIAVIIVNYNSFDQTTACLESLKAHQPDNSRLAIVVVDNASSDRSVQRLQHAFPGISVIGNSENVGYPRAVNQGISAARGSDFFLILNPDTAMTPYTLERLVDFVVSHPETGAVTCSLLLEDETVQISFGAFPSLFTYITDHSLLHPLRMALRRKSKRWKSPFVSTGAGALLEPLVVDWIMGSCMLIPASVVNKVGLFDERFFMYFEDTDYCKRIRQYGFEVYYLAGLSIYHYHKGVSRKYIEATYYQLFYSLLLYHKKHSSLLTRVGIRSLMTLDMLFRVPLYIILYILNGMESQNHKKRLRATLRVLGLIFSGMG